MTKVICAAVDCEYNDCKNRCTAEKISLTDSYIHTQYDGVKHFNTCKAYQKSEQSKLIEETFMEAMMSAT